MTNKQFAEQDETFKAACEQVNLQPTKRQASKWRSKKGKAWVMMNVGKRTLG
jgi:hypothetical protein